MFSKFDKVESLEFDSHLTAGYRGTIVAPATTPGDWVGVRFPGITFGHDLAGLLPKGSVEGYWVSPASLKLREGATITDLKVGNWVKVIEDHDAARKGQVGIIRQIRSDSYQPYSVQFPGWTDGHNLYVNVGDVKLVGDESREGQYIPGFKLTKVRKPYTRKPKAYVEHKDAEGGISDDQLPEGLEQGKGMQIVLTEEVTSQDGHKVSPGKWFAQVIKVSGRPTILVSFGHGKVLLFEQDDRRIKADVD